MPSSFARFPLWRIAVGNTFWMSSFYFLLALTAEVWRRYVSGASMSPLLWVLEALPARVLAFLGVWGFLQEKYVFGTLNEVSLRLILGLTMVALIFVVAGGVTSALWLLRRPWKAPPG